jgi:hypothetical protein
MVGENGEFRGWFGIIVKASSLHKHGQKLHEEIKLGQSLGERESAGRKRQGEAINGKLEIFRTGEVLKNYCPYR